MHRRGGLLVRPLGAAARRLDRLPARVLLSLGIAVCAGGAVRADGPAFLVKDINTQQAVREPYEDEPSSYPHDFAVLDGVVYFAAGDLYDSYGEGPNGDELWRSDGTPAGTYLVKDINPGHDSAYPRGLQVHEGVLYFLADDGAQGPGLWRSHGTVAGTERVAALGHVGQATGLTRLGSTWLFISSDSFGTDLQRVDGNGVIAAVSHLSSIPNAFYPSESQFVAGEHLAYFVMAHDQYGIELWRTDGTSAGTAVFDIEPGSGSSYPRDLTVIGDTVYFAAYSNENGGAIWRADASGAALVFRTGWDAVSLTAVDGALLFIASQAFGEDWRLWRSDGTTAGTQSIADLEGIPLLDQPLTAFAGALYFSNRHQLWRTDGTAQGTVLVHVGESDPDDNNLILALADGGNALLLLKGDDAGGPLGLWRSDGTQAGTTLVRDLNPITESRWDAIADGRVTGTGIFVFGADNGNGVEPWRSDLTAAGTSQLVEINPGATDIFNDYLYPSFADVNGTLAFMAFDGVNGGLWRSDATASGTVPVNAVDGLYYTPQLWPLGDRVYFSYAGAVGGQELWELPSLDDSARFLTDIFPGDNGSFPSLLGSLEGELIFSADDGVHGTELYAPYDQGLVADLTPGSDSSYPREPVIQNGTLFFLAGSSLWRTDGTPLGTALVADVGAGYSARLVGGADRLAVITSGIEGTPVLWYSDGTTDGTVRVAEFPPVPDPIIVSDSWPRPLGWAGRILVFSAGDSAHGVEVWRSDGTAAGTGMLTDISPGPGSSFPGAAVSRGDTVLFFADDPEHGIEPWISDGSSAGTALLLDIQPGPSGSRNRLEGSVTTVGNAVIFSASDGSHGLELWQSDGSAAGTTMLQDITPGARSSSPNHFVISGDHLFFTANDNEHGRELWALPLHDIACSQGCPDPRTPSPTPHRTPRPIWTPGAPLPTYTATPGPTPHCHAPGDGYDCVFLNVGSASGAPGDRVDIDVTFRTGGLAVAGVQLDLGTGDTVPYRRLEDDKPDCHVNPAINKGYTAFSDPRHDGSLLRALVLSVENVDPIPDDSLLFTCSYQIPADAALGTVPVHCENFLGSTPKGEAIPPPEGWAFPGVGELRCNDGEITIAYPTPTGTPDEGDRGLSSAGSGGDGCQVGSVGSSQPLAILLLPLTLLLLRRRGG